MALQFGKVTGRFVAVVADSPEDSDSDPDIVPLQGVVTFTLKAPALLVPDAEPFPMTALPAPVSATLDSEGYLTLNGTRSVTLLASNGQHNPTSTTYEVKFALKHGTISVPYSTFNISVPAGETVNLTTAAPVPSSSGSPIVQGIGIKEVTADDGAFVFKMTNGTTNRVALPEITSTPAPSDGAGTKNALASLLALPRYRDQVTDDKPTTFTVGTTDTMNTNGAVTSYLSTYQPAGRQVPTEGRMDEGLAPMEFTFNGSEMQIRFQAMNWGALTTQVWVDNKPVTIAPVVNNSITPPSTIGYIYLKWETARSRRIRVMNRGGAIQELRVGNPQDQVMPVADTPLLGLVVDSFGGATDYANDTQTLTEWLSRSLNANVMVSTVGGSGYLTGGQLNQKYGDGARRYLLRTSKLDALLFFGSINDPFQETEEVTRKAFRDAWDFYAAENATAPIVVFGVQPSGAETTVGMPVHRNNHLMYLEALAHPRVVGFVDMLGTAKGDGAGPTPWEAATQYSSSSVVAYNGAVYGATVESPATFTNATPPASSPYWRQISWIFNGTGNTGNLKKDGNRDYLIGADNTHPMPGAGYAFGTQMAAALLRVLSSAKRFTYFNVQ